MTSEDRMALLRRVVDQLGQAEVARRIGRAPSAINQILKGTYKASPEAILERVAAEFGEAIVDCPIMGAVPLARCIEERSKPFKATNPQRRTLIQACQVCKHRR